MEEVVGFGENAKRSDSKVSDLFDTSTTINTMFCFFVLGRIGQTNMLDKVLFNCIPFIHCTAKLNYCELLLFYVISREIMSEELKGIILSR